jgi:Domain of unknown function (DUF4291)
MKLQTERYCVQASRWPADGRHILAHYDDTSIVVYQAYRHSIAEYALTHGRLDGPDFSLSRMSWIKPNFLWMMYRSGWATKVGQERVLGLRIRRSFFDEIVSRAIPSSYDAAVFASHADWSQAVTDSDVRLQWDPDHSPWGVRLSRRAIQLGLRGVVLNRFATEELLEVIDMTGFVHAEREHATQANVALLGTPTERPYTPMATLRWTTVDTFRG